MASSLKTTLITGAAKGLGRATAEKFLKEGWTVIGVDKEKMEYTGPHLMPYRLDITDHKSLLVLKEDLESKGIQLSVLVNNAGFFRFFPITDSDPDQLETIFKVNALAPFSIINVFRDDLVRNNGRVINISSENVKLSGLFQPYPSTKIALESLSIAARQELGLVGVRLILIQPGAIETDLLNWHEPVSEIYSTYLDRFFSQAKQKMSGIVPPSKVASLVYKAATVSKPKILYRVNHNKWLSVFSKLPESIKDRIITRMLK